MQLNWTSRLSLTNERVETIKEIAGVYRLIYRQPDDNSYYVYYVGQAENLRERLYKHLPENETSSCCKKHLKNYNCYFRAAAVSRQSDRDGIEVTLYNKYKPECVEKIPDAEPIDINFE